MCYVVGKCSTEDVQNMGVYGHDGPNSTFLLLTLHRENVRRANGQRCRVGVDNNGTASLHHDVLSRLRGHSFRRSPYSGL